MKYKTLTTSAMIAALMLGTLPVRAQEPQEPETSSESTTVETPVEEKDSSLFSGIVVSPGSIGSLTQYGHVSGAEASLELGIQPWSAEPQLDLSVGARTPWAMQGSSQRARVSGAVDLNPTTQTAGYTAFVELAPTQDLTLRVGSIGHSPTTELEKYVGGFGGVRVVAPNFTLDADGWMTTQHGGVHGFAAVSGIGPQDADKGLYLSVGGKLRVDLEQTLQEGELDIVAGWIDQGAFGLYSQTRIDLLGESQAGTVLIAPHSTFTRGTFDFKSHIRSGTGMRGVSTGYILDGWAPFDSSAGEDVVIALDWSHDASATSIGTRGYVNIPTVDMFVGAGFSGTYHPELDGKEQFDPVLSVEMHAAIPKTPLDAWGQVNVDLQTGEITPVVYFGGAGSF
jgi:hypothetical protein